jgi:hypothetical protein
MAPFERIQLGIELSASMDGEVLELRRRRHWRGEKRIYAQDPMTDTRFSLLLKYTAVNNSHRRPTGKGIET